MRVRGGCPPKIGAPCGSRSQATASVASKRPLSALWIASTAEMRKSTAAGSAKLAPSRAFARQRWYVDRAGRPRTFRHSASLRPQWRSEEHTSELQSLMRISYAVFCLKKKKTSQPPDQQIEN